MRVLGTRVLPDVRAGWVLGRREFDATMRSGLTYVVLAVALGLAAWILGNDVDLVRSNGLLIDTAPFREPIVAAVIVLSLFMALLAVLSVARDRDQGTLEVLFYGPVDEVTYLFGKLIGLLGAYIVMLPLVLAAVIGLEIMTGFELGLAGTLAAMALSVLPAAMIIVVGLMVSVLAGRARSSILVFLAAAALFTVVGVAHSLVSEIEITDPASALLPLRDALAAADDALERISPFTYLERVVSWADEGAWGRAGRSLLVAAAGLGAAGAVAIAGLRRRGVRAREEA